jgi:hypothetical protein
VSGLWLSCWISSLDPTGSTSDNYILWMATAVASGLLAMRLMRPRRVPE